MRKILVFLVGFLLLVGGLLFYQKKTQAGFWGECSSCTDTNCCGERCGSGYFCNNLGYGICFCDRKTQERPPTATPGPRPPGPTQPGPIQPGGGGPTPTGEYVRTYGLDRSTIRFATNFTRWRNYLPPPAALIVRRGGHPRMGHEYTNTRMMTRFVHS